MPEQRKVCFQVSEYQDQKVKALPRSYNLSEKLRKELDKILDKYEKEKAQAQSSQEQEEE